MALTNNYRRVALSDIQVARDSRQRREVNTKGLVESIRMHGVLHPIIITGKDGEPPYQLLVGERRYASSQALGLTDIPARFAEDMSTTELALIELEENLKRTDLPWQDQTRAIERIHALYVSLDPDWTIRETGEAVNMAKPTIVIYLRVAAVLDEERIAAAGTVREAYNILSRRDQRAAGDALQELMGITDELLPLDSPETQGVLEILSGPNREAPGAPGPMPGAAPGPAMEIGAAKRLIRAVANPADTLLHESFIQWAPRYTGPKFNLVHCDFPYGIGVFDGKQGGGAAGLSYIDTEDTYFTLLRAFCINLNKFMAASAHLVFWYSDKHRDATMAMFRELAPSLTFSPYPLIWVKSDNTGIASDVRRHPRHVYETALFASRGGRQIIQVVGDAHSSPTDKRWHPSTKPEPMLKHFFTMLVDNNTTLFDPTCGSASAIRAAEELGANYCLGMDQDEQIIGNARMALRNARMLRNSTKASVRGL